MQSFILAYDFDQVYREKKIIQTALTTYYQGIFYSGFNDTNVIIRKNDTNVILYMLVYFSINLAKFIEI